MSALISSQYIHVKRTSYFRLTAPGSSTKRGTGHSEWCTSCFSSVTPDKFRNRSWLLHPSHFNFTVRNYQSIWLEAK